jgi:hypothetical protein
MFTTIRKSIFKVKKNQKRKQKKFIFFLHESIQSRLFLELVIFFEPKILFITFSVDFGMMRDYSVIFILFFLAVSGDVQVDLRAGTTSQC